MAACWPLLPLSGGGRGSDSLGSQFDPAVRRLPMSGSSSLATRPPAHPPYLAPAYWRPTAHALALRVGGRAGWQALAQMHFGKSCCPHTSLSEVLTSVQNIKGLRIRSLPLVACRPVQKVWLQYGLKVELCIRLRLLRSFDKYLCYPLTSLTPKVATSPPALCVQLQRQ